ncbi:MAG: hypothetical protein ABEN55_13490 [Bradymonadaceae bacterium]
MYCDTPSIASEPIYVGPPDTLELEDDVGPVRVWSDGAEDWIDHEWARDDNGIEFVRDESTRDFLGTIRVVEMRPAGEHEVAESFEGYGDE